MTSTLGQVFKKRRKGPSPARPVSFDRWCGDPVAPEIRRALEAGDSGSFAEAYDEADAHRREFLVQTLMLDLPEVAALDAWPDAEPGSALAFLARGVQRIAAAWEARGSGYAETVGEGAWDVFFDHLRGAAADPQRSVELHVDGVAWSRLLISALGLQLTTDELRARYARAIEASPGLPFAADSLLQALRAKWLRTHEEMFAFARETRRLLPRVTRVIA